MSDVPSGPAEAAISSPDAPLLVLSFPRSGTTLLRALLHGHPDLAIPPEPWWMVGLLRALRRERRSLTRGLATSHLAAHVPVLWLTGAGLALEDIVACLPAGPMREAEVVSAVGKAYAARCGKKRWGAKDPGAQFRGALPLLRSVYPQGTFLFLARDVRDVYLSQLAAGLRRSANDLYLYVLLWAVQTKKILDELEGMGKRGLVVRYEDLVAAPEEALTRVCDAAGLEKSPEVIQRMLDHRGRLQGKVARNPIHRNLQGPLLDANRRKFASRLLPEQVRRTELLARPVLKRLGYSEGGGRAGLADGVSVGTQIPLRLAANAWKRYLGKSTLTGMDLPQRAS